MPPIPFIIAVPSLLGNVPSGCRRPREHYYMGLGRAVPIDEPHIADAFRAAWALSHGLATFVVKHTFQLVDTDEARLAAADGAIDVFVEMLAARWPSS